MHLYVHVPFCARRCSYCDFAIAVRKEVPSEAFRRAIEREWSARHAEFGHAAIATLYFGGGTPSHLAPEELARLVVRFGADRGYRPGVEVTLETNPDDVTPERAAAWREAGVNRISLGVQSHDPGVLEWMHRTHRAEQVPQAVRILRRAGFDNISLDLIFALPPHLRRDWSADLHSTLALEPEHLSLYGLTVEPHTPLSRWAARGEVSPVADERYAEEYLEAVERLGGAGFTFYEVSNAARDPRRSQHNAAYWTGADYLGLGPSAHSHRGDRRMWNIREWSEYLRRSDRGDSVEQGAETLDHAARRLEARYLGLRTSAGLPASDFPEKRRAEWVSAGWAFESEGRIRLTPEGWLRLDALVAELRDS